MRDQTETGNLWCYCVRTVEAGGDRVLHWSQITIKTDYIVPRINRKVNQIFSERSKWLKELQHVFKNNTKSDSSTKQLTPAAPAELHTELSFSRKRSDRWTCSVKSPYLPCSSSGLTDCCLRRGACLVWLVGWPSNEMRFLTGGWLKVWARRRKCCPGSTPSSGKAGGEPGGEWPGDSSSWCGVQKMKRDGFVKLLETYYDILNRITVLQSYILSLCIPIEMA